MRSLSAACIVVGLFVLLPSETLAQGSITGVVRDSSGQVVPGVTVEAASPVLIEKVRTAVSDGNGQYRIVDLRAGTYTVTFTLSGFNTYKRDGIELTGQLIATVNGELRVGRLEETVTVSGESPIVDVQSIRRQTVIGSDLIAAIPAARTYAGLMTLMPNTVQAGGAAANTQVVPQMVVFGGAGGRTNEGRVDLDGLSVGSAFNGAGVSPYIADVGNAQEVALISSGGLGETEVGGPSLNVVPREGGNSMRGSFYSSGVTERMVDSNYTEDLKNRGLTTSGQYQKIWDFSAGIGGPIVKDRLWYFGTFRDEGSHRTIPGAFANANAGDPTKWLYVADLSRPAVAAVAFRNTALRLTSQVTPRHKVTFFWDEQKPCEGAAFAVLGDDLDACRHSGPNEIIAGSAAPTPTASGTSAPETAGYRDYGQRVRQARWTSPLSNRLLLEGGVGQYRSRWGGKTMPGANTENLIRVVEQCATSAGCAANGGIPNLTYRSPNWASNVNQNINWRGSATYVLGSQSMKLGYQGAWLYDERKNFTNSEFLQYRTQNGVPDQITLTINQFPVRQRVRYDAVYAQDQWTLGRMTLQGALRYDHAYSYFPEAQVGPVRFFPTGVVYPETKGVEGYNDITPRFGVAIDVFGNGKTALKVNAGRYLEAAQNGGAFIASNPTGRLATTTTRSWEDANGDRVVNCDLLNSATQNPRLIGTSPNPAYIPAVDSCGVYSNLNFGQEIFESRLDDALVSGWGVRPSDWQFGVSVQHEIVRRVSAEVGYQRRWLGNFQSVDNFNRAVEDHTVFGVNVPADSRLPDGGGYVLEGLYNVTTTGAARLNDNVTTLASNYGDWSQVANSANLNITARPLTGLALQGGFNVGKTSTDRCDIRAALPEMSVILTPISPTNPWCAYSTEFFRVTGLGSYLIPKVEVQVAGTFRSDQGSDLAANWAAPNSQTVGLNRPYAGTGGATTVQVNLIEPGILYGDRVNQVDLRFAKILRFGRTRTNVGFDVYNITNANPVLTYNESFNPATTTWLTPQSVLQSRFVKFSAQIDF